MAFISLSRAYGVTMTPFEFPTASAPARLLPPIGVLIVETSKVSAIRFSIASDKLEGTIAILSVVEIATPRFGFPFRLALLIIKFTYSTKVTATEPSSSFTAFTLILGGIF